MNSRISIRGISMTTGAAVAGVAVAAGLNVSGALGDLTPSQAKTGHSAAASVAASSNGTSSNDTSSDNRTANDAMVAHTRHAWQRHNVAQAGAHARKVRKERAAKAAAAARGARQAVSRSSTRHYAGDPRSIARGMMSSRYGWTAGQFSCLNSLWNRESGWNVHAANSSGAYGIPQALPGSKMSTKGADWRNNPATQIAWGLSYVKSTYGTPCGAWSAFQSKGWY